MIPKLIYSSAKTKRYQEIALRYGFLPGAQLPATVYVAPYFCDNEYKKPNRAAYMEGLAKYRPALASVIDWELHVPLREVLSWAEEAAQYVSEAVIIIPKVHYGIGLLPKHIDGRQVWLGYSIPTSHGGTKVSIREFEGWPVHLLGGDPDVQIRLSRRLDVRSIDNNYIQEAARRAQFRSPATPAKRYGWPTLKESGLGHLHDAPYIAFELTCIAVTMAWQDKGAHEVLEAQRAWLQNQGHMIPARQLLFA